MEKQIQRLPNGPSEDIDLGFSDDVLIDIQRLFEEYGDLYKVYSPTRKAYTYVVSHPDLVKHVLVTNNRNYTKGVGIERVRILLGEGIMVSEGDYWKRQRRMIQPAFHRQAIANLAESMTQENLDLIEKWSQFAAKEEALNLTEEMSQITLNVVMNAIFSKDMSRWQGPDNPFDLLTDESDRDLKFAFKFRSLGKLIRKVVEDRRAENRVEEDFLSMLMEAKDKQTGEMMTMKELLDEAMTLIVAGHETTASALNWAWYLISQHPEVEQKIFDEVDQIETNHIGFEQLPTLNYIGQVVKETMRLYPPGWLLTRKAIKDDSMNGYDVPAKTDVFVCPYLIQRHPDFWENPNEFDPDRFLPEKEKERPKFAYFPFAAGPRQCIGDYFAMVEMQIHIAMMSKKFRMVYQPKHPLEIEPKVNLRTKHPLYMLPKLR